MMWEPLTAAALCMEGLPCASSFGLCPGHPTAAAPQPAAVILNEATRACVTAAATAHQCRALAGSMESRNGWHCCTRWHSQGLPLPPPATGVHARICGIVYRVVEVTRVLLPAIFALGMAFPSSCRGLSCCLVAYVSSRNLAVLSNLLLPATSLSGGGVVLHHAAAVVRQHLGTLRGFSQGAAHPLLVSWHQLVSFLPGMALTAARHVPVRFMCVVAEPACTHA